MVVRRVPPAQSIGSSSISHSFRSISCVYTSWPPLSLADTCMIRIAPERCRSTYSYLTGKRATSAIFDPSRCCGRGTGFLGEIASFDNGSRHRTCTPAGLYDRETRTRVPRSMQSRIARLAIGHSRDNRVYHGEPSPCARFHPSQYCPATTPISRRDGIGKSSSRRYAAR